MRPDTRTRICQRIKRLLEERGQTQRKFAKAMGHGDQWASNYLQGKFALSMDQLDTAAAFFGVPPGEIVRLSENAAWDLSPTEMRVVRALRMLPSSVRDHLVVLADYLIGATPEEVDLLKRVRQLTADQFRRIEHYMDVELLARGTEPSQASPVDLRVTNRPPAVPARRTRKPRSA